jgi:hypothetical protein
MAALNYQNMTVTLNARVKTRACGSRYGNDIDYDWRHSIEVLGWSPPYNEIVVQSLDCLDLGERYHLTGYLFYKEENSSPYLQIHTYERSPDISPYVDDKPEFELLATVTRISENELSCYWEQSSPWLGDEHKGLSKWEYTARVKLLFPPRDSPARFLNKRCRIKGVMDSNFIWLNCVELTLLV